MRRFTKILQIKGVKTALNIALILLVFVVIKIYKQSHLAEGIAPTIKGMLLDGQYIDSQFNRGQPVLLHFWATWCPVCQLEQDSIDAISKDHAVITVAINSGNKTEVKTYLEENNLNFPVIVDEHSLLAGKFGVQGVPTSFVIDPEGNIAFTEVGYTTHWGLRLRLWIAGN